MVSPLTYDNLILACYLRYRLSDSAEVILKTQHAQTLQKITNLWSEIFPSADNSMAAHNHSFVSGSPEEIS